MKASASQPVPYVTNMPSNIPSSPSKFIYCLEIFYSDESNEELIIALLDSWNIDALEQDQLRIKVYHEDFIVLQEIQEFLESKKSIVSDTQIIELEDKNWNKLWESSFEPVNVEDFCTVRASFHKASTSRFEIIIDPEMAFGTGHHETTYLMMLQMKEIPFQSKTVLDFGCGTGILAILAEKLGSAQIAAIDNDPVAIQCAVDCIEKNQSKHIEASTKGLDHFKGSKFDVILANINRNVLLEYAVAIASLQNSGAQLLLSGILVSDILQIKEQFEANAYLVQTEKSKGDWSSLLFSKI